MDDLHAAEEASLLVWQRLCAATTRTPLLLIGTLRPVPRRTGVDRLRRILKDNGGVSISLDRLPADDVATLAGRLLGAVPGPRLAERLTSAGGNPLYVRELVDSLVGSSAIVFADGRAELADAEPGASTRPAAVVDSLAAAVADRLGFLGAETLDALRTAALLGPEFAVADLSAALHRPAGLLAPAVQEGVAAGIVEPVGLRLRFRHGLLRQALYETTPEPQRTALRRSAVRALIDNAAPVDRVAELVISDLDAADGWEAEWVAQHADDLARRSPELAAELFELILGHADLDEQRRATLQDLLTDLCFTLARYDQAAELAYQEGRWDDALIELGATRGIPPPALYPRHSDTPHGLAALISVRRDDQRGADRHLKALTGSTTPYALLAQALYEERAGRPGSALSTLRVVLEPAYGAPEHHTPLLPVLAATAAEHAQGHIAQWCRALTDNDPNQLAEVADHLRSVGRRPELAWALEDLAVLRAPGGAACARATLAEARALSGEYGGAWDARRATARLRALGVRPGNRTVNRPRTGPPALTETERRVADLAAQGLSNPDIAAMMSLSRRTVETHVSRILAKLGARSRHEIAEAMRHE